MAHAPDGCPTCEKLANSEVVVVPGPGASDDERFFAANVVVEAEPKRFTTPMEARAHPIARLLWMSGVCEVVLEPGGARVKKRPAARWAFLEGMLARVLQEQLTLRAG